MADPADIEAMNDHLGAHHRLLIHAFTLLRRSHPVEVELLLKTVQDRRDNPTLTPRQRERLEIEADMLEKATAFLDRPLDGSPPARGS